MYESSTKWRSERLLVCSSSLKKNMDTLLLAIIIISTSFGVIYILTLNRKMKDNGDIIIPGVTIIPGGYQYTEDISILPYCTTDHEIQTQWAREIKEYCQIRDNLQMPRLEQILNNPIMVMIIDLSENMTYFKRGDEKPSDMSIKCQEKIETSESRNNLYGEIIYRCDNDPSHAETKVFTFTETAIKRSRDNKKPLFKYFPLPRSFNHWCHITYNIWAVDWGQTPVKTKHSSLILKFDGTQLDS